MISGDILDTMTGKSLADDYKSSAAWEATYVCLLFLSFILVCFIIIFLFISFFLFCFDVT